MLEYQILLFLLTTFAVSASDFYVSASDFYVSAYDNILIYIILSFLLPTFAVSASDFYVSASDFYISASDFYVSAYDFCVSAFEVTLMNNLRILYITPTCQGVSRRLLTTVQYYLKIAREPKIIINLSRHIFNLRIGDNTQHEQTRVPLLQEHQPVLQISHIFSCDDSI